MWVTTRASPMEEHTPPQVGEFACLEVVDVSRHGLHLDWGRAQDLFMPFSLQNERLRAGDHVVVAILQDEQGRPYGTARLNEVFDWDTRPLRVDQRVLLIVYGFNRVGTLVIVNGRYAGLVYDNESFERLRLGQHHKGWISRIRDDGRLDIRIHEKIKQRSAADGREVLLQKLAENGGFLPLHDKSSPAEIRSAVQMSKKVFKRLVGNLYREQLVTLDEDGIRLATGDAGR